MNKSGEGKRRPLNAFMKAVMNARKTDAKSFDYNGKTYFRRIAKTGMILYSQTKESTAPSNVDSDHVSNVSDSDEDEESNVSDPDEDEDKILEEVAGRDEILGIC